MRYARTCALVLFIYEQEDTIYERSRDLRERHLHLRSLHTNLLQLLEGVDINVSVPESEHRYKAWWQALSAGLQEGKKVTEVVKPLRKANQNTLKLHETAQHYLRCLYVTGPAMPAQQIYDQLIAHAAEQGWWQTEKGFNPPSYRAVARFLQENEADLSLGRQGDSAVYNHYLPQISRELPDKKNALWGADATAHNELVYHNGRTRQSVYAVYIFDYATGKLLACEPYLTGGRYGQGERAETCFAALSQAIRSTDCCPLMLQIDQGPAFTKIKEWCEPRGIKVVPAGVKNARAKLVEILLGRLQSLLTRYRSSWSGMNISAQGLSSHPSPEQLSQHAKAAPSAEEVMDWLRTEQLTEYNSILFKKWNGKPCAKSPNELWEELLSASSPLPSQQLAMYAGHCHRIKFTKAGLRVQHNGEVYTYYPKYSSAEDRKKALQMFAELKVRSPQSSKRTFYIVDYAKGAQVFDKAWETGGKCKGYWPLLKKVSMLETMNGETSQEQGPLCLAASAEDTYARGCQGS